MLLILVCQHRLFATTPLRRMPLAPLMLPNPVDRTHEIRDHNPRFCKKTNANRAILIEQRLGEVGCGDDEFFCYPLPSSKSINI